jgi:hypothetical protein
MSEESREFKFAATQRLIRKYDINLCIFMELNFDWTTVNSSANLASWFHEEEHDLRFVTLHNTQEVDQVFGRHQPGGTGMVCQHESCNMDGNHPGTQGDWADGVLGPLTATQVTRQE